MERIIGNKKEIYPPLVPTDDLNLFSQLLYENSASTQTFLGKREVFEYIKFDEKLPRFQDWEIILRISLKYNIKFIDRVLVKSYIQTDSISQNPNKAVLALNRIFNIYRDDILKNQKINLRFNIKIAEYMLANGDNPLEYYKNCLRLKFSFKLYIFYVLCILNLNKFLFKLKQIYFSLR
jgi:hypothetical protein